MLRTLLRRLVKLLLWMAALSVVLVLVLRWVPPPFTALMIERKIESFGSERSLDLQRTWRPWSELPDDLKMAVIAAEDQKFAEHWGFDLAAIRAAFEHNEQGGSLRGASTLSQQVGKNLFLWSGRSWARKGLEVWFTALIELLWPKQRILEVYLNSVEWGDGIFGAEAAARHHFNVGAPYLSTQQASQLAAVLPNPRQWSAGKPSAYVTRRASWIRQQMRQLGGSHYLTRLEGERPSWWPSWL
ncbi:monofunctional biosynthetic peptidoglycan transglycosylase [Stutzerimonas nosocomialis]|uniref:Biosynthetic peptidoglycan transglycosylase n=1 Tax=Stutzerimonas nosocomialis TaxID=1056496 RepID=A0A5R9QCX6_9GAMM|nr:monofunctional biosynthetic peptidoglycan transglycosylase [Stutzerimonas nosocomialis]TLX53398.1 monofunctional biosynthetic peptidoglycan transglycosylase [Stutzerimonas nosocomialis]TLX60874.1 monofunctional biosynthetic peptidoglycan transglycosylase [Stutzerimonas nosocomialis]TLX62613.1 monofunctional biosynthetic peptidoglycan transglycosylase [Stutzerimonas nosocomialis]